MPGSLDSSIPLRNAHRYLLIITPQACEQIICIREHTYFTACACVDAHANGRASAGVYAYVLYREVEAPQVDEYEFLLDDEGDRDHASDVVDCSWRLANSAHDASDHGKCHNSSYFSWPARPRLNYTTRDEGASPDEQPLPVW